MGKETLVMLLVCGDMPLKTLEEAGVRRSDWITSAVGCNVLIKWLDGRVACPHTK